MKRLAILSTHPIQYNAPFFRQLSHRVQLEVFFSQTPDTVLFDSDFNRIVQWDVDLISGYTSHQHDGSTRRGRKKLTTSIRAFNPQAILVYGWSPPGHLYTLRTFHNQLSIWFRGDSHLLDKHPPLWRLTRQIFLSWVYQHVNHCFTVGTHNEAYFRWCGLDASQLSRAPHAVDHNWFEKDDAERKIRAMKWRKKLNIPLEAKVILFAGKLEPKKEPELLIRAWLQLNRPDVHLIIAGSGLLEAALRNAYGSDKRIHFIGFQNQSSMPVVYRMAQVFCLPSKGPNETWGLAINEALSCKVPCVVSNKAGCSADIFDQTDLGQVFPSGNIDALTDALKHLLRINPPSDKAWQCHKEYFSFDRFTELILAQWPTPTR